MTTIYRKGSIVKQIDRTRRTSRTLQGFDYALGKPVERTSQEWRQRLHQLVADGGRRRHEHGETFGHARGSLIEFEIYGYVK